MTDLALIKLTEDRGFLKAFVSTRKGGKMVIIGRKHEPVN